jgi:TonB family protein
MSKPRTSIVAVAFAATMLIFSFNGARFGVSVSAQQPQIAVASVERQRGIELYQKGEVKEAIKALREATKKQKDDAEAWHFLGLALFKDNDLKGARKVFQTAAQLRPAFAPTHYNLAFILLLTNKTSEAETEARRALELDASMAEAHYVLGTIYLREGSSQKALEEADATIKLKPDSPLPYLLKSQAIVNLYSDQAVKSTRVISATPPDEARRAALAQAAKKRKAILAEAADSLERYLKLTPDDKAAATWREQLETLRFYAASAGSDQPASERAALIWSEVDVKAHILTKPEPVYTAQARQAGISGTVILHAIFADDATVKHVLVIRSLPYGLTEEAVRAARKIRFQPAMKDGHPVSMFIQIEYNFNVY